ncbi:MAG: hypothetical protein GKR94_08160 [Gammaproteobacteria bacterium]|nr:hypothetical protein [Gammaproteobacteria bacterium]
MLERDAGNSYLVFAQRGAGAMQPLFGHSRFSPGKLCRHGRTAMILKRLQKPVIKAVH